MRFLKIKTLSLLSSLLLGLNFAGSAGALPVTEIGGLAPSGNPNFTFEGMMDNDYSNSIQSSYNNLFYLESNAGGYTLFVSQQGDFTYSPSPNQTFDGTKGIFNLYANFDNNGNFIDGLMAIQGRVSGAGINNASTLLTTGTLNGYEVEGSLMGFSVTIDTCAAQISSECNLGGIESVYFYTAENLPDIGSLGGSNYLSSLASITTVPVPASMWLMVSALGMFGAMARRKKTA